MSHNSQIDKYLAKGNSITDKEARELFGCTRLAARIADLKARGRNIVRTMVEVPTRTGKTRVARYRRSSVGYYK